MALSYVGVSNVVGTQATSLSVVAGAVSGDQEGDLLVMLAQTNIAGAIATPSGWNLIGSAENNATMSSALFWRIADGTADDTPTVTSTGTGGNNSNGLFVSVWAWRGAHPGTPILQNAKTAIATTATPQSSALTGVLATSVVMCVVAIDDDNTWSSGMPPALWTARTAATAISASGADARHDAISRTGSGSIAAVTVGTMIASDPWVSRTIEIAVAPPLTPITLDADAILTPTLDKGTTLARSMSADLDFMPVTATMKFLKRPFDGIVSLAPTIDAHEPSTSTPVALSGVLSLPAALTRRLTHLQPLSASTGLSGALARRLALGKTFPLASFTVSPTFSRVISEKRLLAGNLNFTGGLTKVQTGPAMTPLTLAGNLVLAATMTRRRLAGVTMPGAIVITAFSKRLVTRSLSATISTVASLGRWMKRSFAGSLLVAVSIDAQRVSRDYLLALIAPIRITFTTRGTTRTKRWLRSVRTKTPTIRKAR